MKNTNTDNPTGIPKLEKLLIGLGAIVIIGGSYATQFFWELAPTAGVSIALLLAVIVVKTSKWITTHQQ